MFTWDFFLSAVIDGLAYSSMIYMASLGLVIIFGLMDVFNLAHGAFFGLGAYLFVTLYYLTGNFVLSAAVTLALGALVGLATERLVIKPVYGNPLAQLLVTMGLMTLLFTLIQLIWPTGLTFPETSNFLVSGYIEVGSLRVRVYKLLLASFGFLLFAAVSLVLSKTMFGVKLRAGTESRELAEVFGINVSTLFMVAFSLGVALAFLGGALVAPLTHATVELPVYFSLLSFAIPVVGGMKSYTGAFYASLLIGFIDRFTAYFAPWITFAIDLFVMIIVLVVKPEGLFGR
ncbi:branched-chain amino acid ABC transporter permease [Infirmifilum sp. NZ]|uniref:branched-chain amino acid ABC transporter permease n=1 Tax=Infirmifilum sp. NZ TaxID=2926850 RepID=UPI00279E8884|nr:branched-chain amino acid ABC transporter permease [Infirmifilum sp. NZ]UNQ73487.1 branched-chain amino acid ABC transporter permease [Infirmifilum sp. NZ]